MINLNPPISPVNEGHVGRDDGSVFLDLHMRVARCASSRFGANTGHNPGIALGLRHLFDFDRHGCPHPKFIGQQS